MEGVRQWVARHHPKGMFINFDGLDSRGHHRVMTHTRCRWGPTRATENGIAEELAKTLRLLDGGCRCGRLPPGVFVDGAILAAAGMSGVTVSRGDSSTLRVVHTHRDSPERVNTETFCAIGGAVARATEELLG